MKVTFERGKLRPSGRGAVISIGVFDGVHLGHQAILAANVARARELDAEPTVVTFRRHPKQLLLGRAPRTLTTLEHRLELFRRAGIEHAVPLRFDDELRAHSAEEFARAYLTEGLGVRSLVLGFDSKLGHDREGTPERLRELGFDVEVVPEVIVQGRAVSSTAIREAVELGDLDAARAMLGRRVSIFGQVIRGDEIGRGMGFPTANLDLHHELHPPGGVYACLASGVGDGDGSAPQGVLGQQLPAVANIGTRPTIDPEASEVRIEVHLLDFRGDLYGERMELEFVARLRAEQSFPDMEALRAQIDRDVAAAREALAGA